MVPISVVIITFNEEKNILRCLRSVAGIADEIVVLDSFSTDNTKNICISNNVKFFEHPFHGFNEQKNLALSYASHDFVLSLDADEVLSTELRNSIIEIKENPGSDGYTMNRLTNYCGKWIRHTWYPDTKLRLFMKSKGSWDNNIIHEKIQMLEGARVSHVKGDLLHYSYYTLDDHFAQLRKFTEISARMGFENGKKSNLFLLFYKPIGTFLKLYILKQGFRDGYSGFLIARISAFGAFMKYARLRQLYSNKDNES